jgi:hypothetical protein
MEILRNSHEAGVDGNSSITRHFRTGRAPNTLVGESTYPQYDISVVQTGAGYDLICLDILHGERRLIRHIVESCVPLCSYKM